MAPKKKALVAPNEHETGLNRTLGGLVFCGLLLTNHNCIAQTGFSLLPVEPTPSKLDISAGVDFEQNYLRRTGGKESLVTQVNPRLGLSATGNRIQLNSVYRMAFSQSRTDQELTDDNLRHFLSASGQATIDDGLRLSGSADYQEILRDPFKGISLNPTDATNRQGAHTYQAGLNLNRRIPQWANLGFDLSGNYTNSRGVKSTGYDLGSSLSNQSRSGRAYWSFDFRDSVRHPANGDETEIRSYSARIGVPLTRWAEVMGRASRQQAYSDGQAQLGSRWITELGAVIEPGYRSRLTLSYYPDSQYTPFGAVLLWNPTRRSGLTASYQEYSYGDAWQLDVYHSTSKLRNNLSYSDSLTSYDREVFVERLVGQLICPIGETDINNCRLPRPGELFIDTSTEEIVRFVSQEPALIEGLYRQQGWYWSSALQGRRTTVALNASLVDRTDLTFEEKSTTSSAGLSVSRRMGPSLSTQLGYSWLTDENNANQAERDQLHSINIGATTALSQAVTTSLTGFWQFSRNDGSVSYTRSIESATSARLTPNISTRLRMALQKIDYKAARDEYEALIGLSLGYDL